MVKFLTHASIIEKVTYRYYQNSANLLTHLSIIEKKVIYA